MLAQRVALALLYLLLSVPTALFAQSPYVLGVHTDSNNDTLMQGVEGALVLFAGRGLCYTCNHVADSMWSCP